VKLLFDQNLSPHLVKALADLYPESRHVYELELDEAETIKFGISLKSITIVLSPKMLTLMTSLYFWGSHPKFYGFAEAIVKLATLKHCYAITTKILWLWVKIK
jgi:hypothetical protein